jgi:hypothetical protein
VVDSVTRRLLLLLLRLSLTWGLMKKRRVVLAVLADRGSGRRDRGGKRGLGMLWVGWQKVWRPLLLALGLLRIMSLCWGH